MVLAVFLPIANADVDRHDRARHARAMFRQPRHFFRRRILAPLFVIVCLVLARETLVCGMRAGCSYLAGFIELE